MTFKMQIKKFNGRFMHVYIKGMSENYREEYGYYCLCGFVEAHADFITLSTTPCVEDITSFVLYDNILLFELDPEEEEERLAFLEQIEDAEDDEDEDDMPSIDWDQNAREYLWGNE
jgi:hypothetical protein